MTTLAIIGGGSFYSAGFRGDHVSKRALLVIALVLAVFGLVVRKQRQEAAYRQYLQEKEQ